MEHRRLRLNPPQIELFQPANGQAYVMHTEDVSKTNQGGLAHRLRAPKQVHYANDVNPYCFLVRLYKLYTSKCPLDCPDGAFYLKPLSKPTDQCLIRKYLLGITCCSKLFADCVIQQGTFTNHCNQCNAFI